MGHGPDGLKALLDAVEAELLAAPAKGSARRIAGERPCLWCRVSRGPVNAERPEVTKVSSSILVSVSRQVRIGPAPDPAGTGVSLDPALLRPGRPDDGNHVLYLASPAATRLQRIGDPGSLCPTNPIGLKLWAGTRVLGFPCMSVGYLACFVRRCLADHGTASRYTARGRRR